MRYAFAAALAGLLLFAQAFAAQPTPEERYAAALKTLNAKCDPFCGYGVSDPAEETALDALWDATEDWTVAYLARHSLGDLARTLEKRETDALNRRPNNTAAPDSAVMLTPDLIAFTSGWGETGTVFLAGKRDGKWAVVWDIRKANHKTLGVLKSWTSAAAIEGCRQSTPDDHWHECGPLSGTVTALKPDGQGSPRFLIRATYAQMAGMTVGNQVSFWRWNGRAAEPLIAETYAFMIDDGAATETVSPDKVSLWVKDEFKTFFSCGGCIGRQVKWTFRVLPDRIVDEGKTPVVPELDAVDAFVLAVLNNKPASALGSAQAIASLKAVLDANTDAVDSDMASLARLGMEMNRSVKATPQGAAVCLFADGLPATLFDLERRKGSFFIVAARPAVTESCTQPAKQ